MQKSSQDPPTPISLGSFLPYQVTLLANQIARYTTSVAKRHGGLNLSHWRVLAAIADRPGRSANQVVAVTPMDKGIVSRAVRSLIDQRLVARKASQEDGRVGHLHLTAKGRRRYDAIAAEVRAFDQQLRSNLSSTEQEQLLRLLTRLTSAVIT
ncbi:MAG: MarR family winged helix-turn-helix transcriptional regulator [Myxococcota bacterium]